MNFPFNDRGFIPILPAIGAIAKGSLMASAGKAVGSLLGSAGNAAASNVGGALGTMLGDKIQGIPSALSASEQAQQSKEAMDIMYPGTSAFDRLGARGGGSTEMASATEINKARFKQEKTLQSRELANRSQIADTQALSHLISTAAGYGIDGIKQVVNAFRGAKMMPFDTQTAQQRELLSTEKSKREAETERSKYGILMPAISMGRNMGNNAFDRSQNPSMGQVAWDFWKQKFQDFKKNIPNRFKFSPIPKNE